jgi:hypothetical protein
VNVEGKGGSIDSEPGRANAALQMIPERSETEEEELNAFPGRSRYKTSSNESSIVVLVVRVQHGGSGVVSKGWAGPMLHVQAGQASSI